MAFGRQHAAGNAIDQQRHQNGRKAQQYIRHPHDGRIHDATHEPAKQTQRDAHDRRQRHAGKAHDQRQAQPVKDRGVKIARLLIRAQKIAGIAAFDPCRGQFAVQQEQLRNVIGVLRCQQRRKKGRSKQDQDQHA